MLRSLVGFFVGLGKTLPGFFGLGFRVVDLGFRVPWRVRGRLGLEFRDLVS